MITWHLNPALDLKKLLIKRSGQCKRCCEGILSVCNPFVKNVQIIIVIINDDREVAKIY